MSHARATARAWRGAAWLACSVAAIACGHAVEPAYSNPDPATTPYAGLYVPGSTIGVVAAAPGTDAGALGDGSGISDMAVNNVTGDRCVGTTGNPGTPGMLTVDFSTQLIGEHWAPANVGAVWIEQEDGGEGHFVKTLERWAAVRSRSLYVWAKRACQVWPEVDALSRATLADHNMPHHVAWDGKDLKGHIVPDGMYKLYIEVTETETNFGPLATYEFTKGTMAQTLEPADAPAHKGLKIVYTPSQ